MPLEHVGEPAHHRLADVLERHQDTLASFDSAFGELDSATPAFRQFLSALEPAAPAISEGFFVNFPDQAAEPGTQPFDPFADPRRHYWRGTALLTCQSFGVPIEPGCLGDFLASPSAKRDGADARKGSPGTGHGDDDGAGSGAGSGSGEQPADPGSPGDGGTGTDPGTGTSPLPTDPGVPAAPGTTTTPAAPTTPGAAGDLLDFLLG